MGSLMFIRGNILPLTDEEFARMRPLREVKDLWKPIKFKIDFD